MEELPLEVGRYVLHDVLATGGMAKVHIGRASGALGFSKIVAIKRILPHLLAEQEFVDMFVDETRLAARIQHPNVVSTLDAAITDREVFLVMEFVLGESFGRLMRVARKKNECVPVGIAVAVACGVLRGLHAAHEAKNDVGDLLGVVHRDVSPQNVLVGVDGVPRVIDFGVAKARGRLHTTRDAKIKGKMAYMSPEQLSGHEPDRRTDIYATGVVLWEALVGRKLHTGDNDAIVYSSVMHGNAPAPSTQAPFIPKELDAVILRAISRDARQRFDTAEQMALALEAVAQSASPTAVGEWVRANAGDVINARAARIAEIERGVYTPSVSRTLSAVESGSLPQQGSASHSVQRSAPNSIPTGADGGFGRSMVQDPPTPASKRVTFAIVALMFLACLMASGLVVFVKRPDLLGRAAAQPPPPPVTAVPTPVPVPLPAQPPQPVLTAEPAPPPPPAEPATTATATVAAATPAKKPAAVAPAKVTTTATAAAKKSCDPPWFLDANGIKRFKPECM